MPGLRFSPRLLSRVEEYGASHRHPVNARIHNIGIPVLAICVLGLLARASISVWSDTTAFQPNLAWAALLFAAGWYLALDRRSGWLLMGGLLVCYFIGSAVPIEVLIVLLVAGIVAHAVGHFYFEHKPPAFFSDPAAVLEAPAWLCLHLTGRLRARAQESNPPFGQRAP